MPRFLEALRSRRTDEGFTLVEAVVSMVILALLSTGIIAGTNMIVRMTADNRSRQIAVALAEQQLDLDRGILDPFAVHSFGTCPATTATASPSPSSTAVAISGPTVATIVSGRTYSTSQCTSLVSVDGTDVTCGSGKTLYYRRISVFVDWTGRLATTSAVQSDTILSPNGRINDASTGSIAVQVNGATGTGESGVTVNIDPVSGTAAALQSQPAATDIDGCSYALGVNPGTYKVTVSRSASVDTTQTAAPYKGTVVVSAGTTTPVTFTYDQSAQYNLSYAPGVTELLPTTMPVSFLTSSGLPYISSASSAPPTTKALYPYPAGYTAIAGAVTDANGVTICAAEDPAAWPAGPYLGKTLTSGLRGTTSAGGPGTTAAPDPMTVPMGLFTVKSTVAVYVTAVAQNVTTYGQPGCSAATTASTTPTFTFSTFAVNSTTTLALPYGTYKLYSGGALGSLTTLVGSSLNVTPFTNAVNGVLTSFNPTTGVLTLDPRPGS